LDDLLARLGSEGEHEIYPPAREEDVAETERAIGRALPPSFRAFLTEFSNGAYLFMLQEVSAAGAGDAQIGAIQDALSMVGGSASLVPFSLDHNGNCWCFLTAEDAPGGEYPVAYYDTHGAKLYGRLDGFRAWLEVLVDRQDEVIRTLYDDDTLYGELGLG
jgi:hypothetical protein